MVKADSIKQLINGLTISKCCNFFMRNDGLLHNGVNITEAGTVNTIADGRIIAMRLTDDYMQINSMKYEDITDGYIMGNNLNEKFFSELNSIKYENAETQDRKKKYYFFQKLINGSNRYSLNTELKDYDKIEALYFLNEILSNNFVLMEHKLTKLNGDKIKFYTLYNHLAPLGRMTVEQKLILPWYEHKLTLKESEVCYYPTENDVLIPCEYRIQKLEEIKGNKYKITYISLENGKEKTDCIKKEYIDIKYNEIKSAGNDSIKKIGIPVYSCGEVRTLKEIMPVSTKFEFDFSDIKTFSKKTFKIKVKVKYENKEGCIYLNENNQYTENTWNDEVKKFYKVIDKKENIDFLNFQINVNLKKEYNIKDKVFYPKCSEVGKFGTVIGFSGINFMEEDVLANNAVVLKDEKSKPFTVHVETFFDSTSEYTFDYAKDEKWCPFDLYVNGEYDACVEKPAAEVTAASDVYSMSLIELIGEGKLYSDEIFYKMKVIANVKQNNYYVINGKYTEYDASVQKYKVNKGDSVILYDEKYNQQSTTVFNKKFYYLCYKAGCINNLKTKDGSVNLRKFEYFYEPVEKEYYIRKENYDKLKMTKGVDIYIPAIEGKHFFVKTQLDCKNLCTILSKKILKKERIHGSLEQPVKLEYQNTQIQEYEHLSTFNLKEIWYKTKTEANKEYWIKRTDIKTEKGGMPVEVLSYNDWTKGFEILELNDKKQYRIADYNKEAEEEERIKALKKGISSKENVLSEKILYKLLNDKAERNFIFEHKNEWNNCKQLLNAYTNKSKAKKEYELYAFFDKVKSKIGNKEIFHYVHPYYFIERLSKLISIPEFNPYEGKTLVPRFKKGKDGDVAVKSNPGFSPAIEIKNERHPYEYDGKYWAALNFAYGKTEAYGKDHVGIDLAGITGTPIYSLIHGTVWACTYEHSIKNTPNVSCRGRMMVIKGYNNRLYLLCHLSAYGEKMEEGAEIIPGDIVAKVGDTGKADGAHLHLEVYECNYGNGDDVKKNVLNMTKNKKHTADGGTGEGFEWVGIYQKGKYAKYRRNPLNHEK